MLICCRILVLEGYRYDSMDDVRVADDMTPAGQSGVDEPKPAWDDSYMNSDPLAMFGVKEETSQPPVKKPPNVSSPQVGCRSTKNSLTGHCLPLNQHFDRKREPRRGGNDELFMLPCM